MRNCVLPSEGEILSRIFNTPQKIKRLADEVLGCHTNHVHKLLRGAARSDLGRLCAMISLAASFPDESWEEPGTNLQRAGLLAEYAREHYTMIHEQCSPAFRSQQERVRAGMSILKEAREAIESLSLDKPDSETLQELVELRDKVEEVMTRLESGALDQVNT